VQGALTAVAFRRSARAKRISLRIDPAAGGILITLPIRASRHAGLALLQAHEGWAAEKLAALPQALRFSPGAAVPVHGVPHVIGHAPGARGGAWIEDGRILVAGEPEFLARRVTDCLKALARQHLTAMAAEKAQAFCWRLICAPGFVQDYVVAHETAHLRHMNHGQHFWALTETLTPHRGEASEWLTRNGVELLRIG